MRIELVHPMLVHFPIAFLVVGFVLKVISFWLRKASFYPFLLFSSRLIVLIGVIFAWAAVITGGYAEDVVRKTLCQPKILDIHLNMGWTTAYLFSAALLCDWPREWLKSTPLLKLLTIISSVLYLVGFGFIVTTGAFGGSLVYDQGAAVDNKCIKLPTSH